MQTRLRFLGTGLAVAAFVAVAALLSLRIGALLNVPGRPDPGRWGLVDFRDQIYFPCRAILDGRNPYDQAGYTRAYPVERVFAPYSPLSLVVHMPFALLPLGWAEAAYTGLNLGLVLALASLALRYCGVEVTAGRAFGLGALVLASRPGHWNYVLGQFAVEAALATLLALFYARRRPWIAGLGLAWTTFKPSFGGPLALLMLARKDIRPVALGLSLAAAVQGLGVLLAARAAGGLGLFIASLRSGFAAWTTDAVVNPATTPFRVDAASVVAHALGFAPGVVTELAIAAGVLAAGGLAVRRLGSAGLAPAAADGLSASIICLLVVTSVYHLAYDLVLLVLPLTGLVITRCAAAWGVTGGLRWTLAGLLALPWINYLASGAAIDRLGLSGPLWTGVTALSGMAIFAALLLFLASGLRRPA